MKKERGAFLIVFCMLLTLLLLVSLAVLDISAQRTKKDEKLQHIKLAALAAIDAYYKAYDKHVDDSGNQYDCSVNNAHCVEAAANAANALLLASDQRHIIFDSLQERGGWKGIRCSAK